MLSYPIKLRACLAALVAAVAFIAAPSNAAAAASASQLPFIPFPAPANNNTGGAVLIVASGGEGAQMAKWLNTHGVAGFVLGNPGQNASAADVNHAMQSLRAHAADFKISPDRIGLLGFADGAALAADAAYNHPVSADPAATDPVLKVSSRPNFLALIWGSAPMGAGDGAPAPRGRRGGGGVAGGSGPPPTFLVGSTSTADGQSGMIDLWGQLRGAGVPVDAHFFAKAAANSGLAQDNPSLSSWPEIFYSWVRVSGFLTEQPRVAVQGMVYLDGRILPHGYVILTPIDFVGAGPIIGRVINSTAGTPLGQFSIPANQGPVPGRYKVDVRQNMSRWLSNSFTPGLTGGGSAAAVTFGHYRVLAPSIDDQHSFTKVHPTDKDDYIVEIKPGANRDLNIEVFSK